MAIIVFELFITSSTAPGRRNHLLVYRHRLQRTKLVRHAYFLGKNDPYKALNTTLKAEVDPEA